MAVDPEIREALARLPPELFMPMGPEAIPALRELFAALPADPPASDAVESFDRRVCAEPLLLARVHRPRVAGSARPCVVWIHGGGWVSGSYVQDDALLRHWVEVLDCVCVSLSYRLAPEHPYPAPVDDCDAGLAWVVAHAAELGVDLERIGVAGSSAGACLAVAVALRSRRRGSPRLAFQVLQSPALDDRPPSRSLPRSDLTLQPETIAMMWRAYLGEIAEDDVPEDAVPARAADLAGLPPAFLAIGSHDEFVDQTMSYASRLLAAGVPAALHVLAGAVHGFENLAPDSALARLARLLADDWLQRTTTEP